MPDRPKTFPEVVAAAIEDIIENGFDSMERIQRWTREIRLAAERLAGTGIPLAIVPAGTGNLFSGALGLPIGRSAAIRAIAEGEARGE